MKIPSYPFLLICAQIAWFGALMPVTAGGAAARPVTEPGPAPEEGVTLRAGHLRARIIDNRPRLCPLVDQVMPGYNGVASLIYDDQNRNIFTPVGLNYETCGVVPKAGVRAHLWNAPRVAPMVLQALDDRSARLTQAGADASGLNMQIDFQLGDSWIDQTITFWPDGNIESSSTFFASYMNLVQNTSLYLHGVMEGETEPRWWEMTSAGHFSQSSGRYFRPFDPAGKAWYEFETDNPVRRQAIKESDQSRSATLAAGFKPGKLVSADNFMFGFVDDFVVLWIYRPAPATKFRTWVSASGAETVRRPAWDYAIDSGPQKAGERRSCLVRMVYKPFAGLDDVLQEVARFEATAVPREATPPARSP